MHRAGYKDWRFEAYETSQEERESIWDESGLDVTGFSVSGPGGMKKTPVSNVPLKTLAVDVRREPQGYGALGSTRMVGYFLNGPHESWFYPRDYDAVLRLVGGAGPVRHEDSDRKASKRWTGVSPPPLLSVSTDALLVADERYTEDRKKKLSGIVGDASAVKKQKKIDTLSSAILPMCGTLALETPQKSNKSRGRPNRTVRIEEEPEFEEIAAKDENAMMQASQYLPATAYVAPPKDKIMPWETATESEDEAIGLAFASRDQVGETDPDSAYAFDGPRHAPPYRQLYRIHLPDPADISVWAENVWLSFVQTRCSATRAALMPGTRVRNTWNASCRFGEVGAGCWVSSWLRENSSG